MGKSNGDRRQFVRHPIRVPVSVRPRDGGEEVRSTVGDLSEGGLSFASTQPIDVGSRLDVTLPVGDRRFALVGSVARCLGADWGFQIGLAFVEADSSFRLKLAEQVLRIEELREELSRERGLEVSREEAARRWVDSYAVEFAELYAKTG